MGYLLSEETRIEPKAHHHNTSRDRHIMVPRFCKTVITFNTQLDMQSQDACGDITFVTNGIDL
jgi:hypothetical protein